MAYLQQRPLAANSQIIIINCGKALGKSDNFPTNVDKIKSRTLYKSKKRGGANTRSTPISRAVK